IFICICGESTMSVDSKEVPIKEGDVLYSPTVEKHGLVDRSDNNFRYFEFYTYPPIKADFVEVE
ncbi:hypothetical protein KA005_04865, partial [bacterium]|nr:hypothetical protein [bacterium]